MVSTPTAAQAAEREPIPGVCDVPERGVMYCAKVDEPFTDGITFQHPTDLTIHLEDDLNVAPKDGALGIFAVSERGGVTISGADANVSTLGATAVVASGVEDLTVAIGDVSARGSFAKGIEAFNAAGNIQIDAQKVSTSGVYGLGVVANSDLGNISVNVGSVSTDGFAGDGITARTLGDIVVSTGTIAGKGDYVWGVNSWSGGYNESGYHYGNTSVSTDRIEITGNNAIGVNAISYGNVDVDVGSLKITGDNGAGAGAIGLGTMTIKVDEAEFKGVNTGGIVVSTYGTALVHVGSLTTTDGGGVVAFGVYGGAYAQAESIAVSGDFGNGIQSVSVYGDSKLIAGDVSTNGVFAVAVNGSSGYGHTDIQVGKITTQGELAMGIRAMAGTSSIQITGPISTTGVQAFGILSTSFLGDTKIRSGGSISTQGNLAHAMWVTGRFGNADIQITGPVTTTGDNAEGIRAVGEDGGVKVVAGSVSTVGANSHGISAKTRFAGPSFGPWPGDPKPSDGDIDIRAERVEVSGTSAIGINAKGLGKSTIDVGSVSAYDARAIEVDAVKSASVTVRDGALSQLSDAMSVTAADVAVDIASGATVEGGVNGIVLDAVGERQVGRGEGEWGGPGGDEIGIGSTGTASAASLPDLPAGEGFGKLREAWSNYRITADSGSHHGGASTSGASTQPVAATPGTSVVNNAGTIRGGSGQAILAYSGTTTVNNSGQIIGGIEFADGDDLIDNSGLWEVAKDSNFGDGVDRVDNGGLLRLATTGQVQDLRLQGLDRLDNSGSIELRNGVAGDRLTIEGDYHGSDGARLGLDISRRGAAVDQLNVTGTASGHTKIKLTNVDANSARLTGKFPTPLVTAGSGSSKSAFDIDESSQDIGFIRYSVLTESKNKGDGGVQYLLKGVAGPSVHRLLDVAGGAAAHSQQASEAVTAHLASLRAAGGRPEADGRPAFWGQVRGAELGLADGRIGMAESGRPAVRGQVGQFGFDVGRMAIGSQGTLSFGVINSYVDASRPKPQFGEDVDYRSMSSGIYAGLYSGNFFGSLLTKYDRHSIRASSAALGYRDRFDGRSLGVELNSGYHLGRGATFFEPTVGLSWQRVDLEDLRALGQTIDFDSGATLQGKLGARMGTGGSLANSGRYLFHAGAQVVHSLAGRHGLVLHSGDASEHIREERRTFGTGTVGLSIFPRAGVEAFLQGQGDFGGRYEDVGGQVGLRITL